ncbi:MAG: hypothetical protein A2Y62_21630, partial [Candidatus Fischerbacteria bacterium RBG_13_37_8]
DRWYGGIATADCVGCMLQCAFCWSGEPKDKPAEHGNFYTPGAVFNRLDKIARSKRFHQLRVSGNEPALSAEHLIGILGLVEKTGYTFILETSGIPFGADKAYVEALTGFRNLEVRVSLKGCSESEFAYLTGARPEAYQLQINAIQYCVENSIRVYPAVMLSFSTEESYNKLRGRLNKIKQGLGNSIDEEYVMLYPAAVKRLKKAGIKPAVCFDPKGIPVEFI